MEEKHSWHCCILAIQLEKIGTSFGTYSWQLEGSIFAGRAGRASGSLGRQESETPWENAVVLSWTGCSERKVTVGENSFKTEISFHCLLFVEFMLLKMDFENLEWCKIDQWPC